MADSINVLTPELQEENERISNYLAWGKDVPELRSDLRDFENRIAAFEAVQRAISARLTALYSARARCLLVLCEHDPDMASMI